jgi:steroid 5-alpha reductase family enzyme
MKKLKAMLTPTFILEACALLGIAGIGVSVWLIYWQLTFGVVGCLLLLGAVHGAWQRMKPNRRPGP